jgi:chemotaxis protein methyltransferase CheR
MLEEKKTLDEMDRKTLGRVIEKVHLLTGITMSEHKKTLLQSRLRKRMRDLQIDSYEGYMDYLDKTSGEFQNFINVVTTNETYFFRTPKIWNYFQKDFLPEWYKNNPKGFLKIWSAASSSGEEAFSLAISCAEFKLKSPGFDFKIMASDISSAVLEEAAKGEYFERSVDSFRKNNPAMFEKYLKSNGDGSYQVSSELKKYVQFSAHNLYEIKKDTFDIVFLRNVLIYFSSSDQEKVIRNVSKSFRPDGVLVIGESESISRLETPFDFKDVCIYSIKSMEQK